MSATTLEEIESAASPAAAGSPRAAPRARRRLLVLALVPVLLGLSGAGAWWSGLLGGRAPASDVAVAPAPPVFAELPDIVSNLNSSGRRATFVKLKVKVELSRKEDLAPFNAALPRVLDLFQTYLREMRPEEMRGSGATYRLREELIARASLAAAPARVVDVLFTELLVQ